MLSRQSDGVRCRASGPGLWQVLPWAALAAAPGICRNSGLLAGFTARQEATAAVTRHFPVPEGLPGIRGCITRVSFPVPDGIREMTACVMAGSISGDVGWATLIKSAG
jgi:hypothetical protein